MSLWDKLEQVDPGAPLPVHVFGSVLRLWFTDVLTNVQAQTLLQDFIARDEPGYTLLPQDVNDLLNIRAHFDGLSADGQNKYNHEIESASTLLEQRMITQAEFKTIIGLT